jgi:hypothetical protein
MQVRTGDEVFAIIEAIVPKGKEEEFESWRAKFGYQLPKGVYTKLSRAVEDFIHLEWGYNERKEVYSADDNGTVPLTQEALMEAAAKGNIEGSRFLLAGYYANYLDC